MSLKQYILQSEHADHIDCLLNTFNKAGITNRHTLENAPTILRGHVCGLDIYQVVAALLHEMDKPVVEAPTPVKKRKRKVVKEEQT